jgi:hypothetical protein
VAAEKIEDGFRLAGFSAQMQIGDEKCAITPNPRLMLHVIILRFQHDERDLK